MVSLWTASLDLPSSLLTPLMATLSEPERTRAARFHFARDHDRFIAGRGLLRRLLGRHLAMPPEQIRLMTGPNGKPELDPAFHPGDLTFNLSHSENRALFGLTYGRRIGVDIERVRPNIEIETLAERFFAPGETAALMALPEAQRVPAFFACWTRKEAYLKALGEGIGFGLDRFEVSLTPDAPPALLSTAFDPEEAMRWTLYSLDVSSDFAAAVVIEGSPCPLILHSLSDSWFSDL